MLFFINIGVEFDLEENNTSAKVITEKIMTLPIADRLWPNCLNRPIKNASMVDVDDYSINVRKIGSKLDRCSSEMFGAKGAAARTRSKLFTFVPKPSFSIQSIAELGGCPSYVWRSMLADRDVLKANCCKGSGMVHPQMFGRCRGCQMLITGLYQLLCQCTLRILRCRNCVICKVFVGILK